MIITHPHFNVVGLRDEHLYSWESVLHNTGKKGPRFKSTMFVRDLIKRK